MAFPSPSLEPPTLENFQFEYNGLKFGAGTAWGVLGVEGLDLAEIRNGDAGWPRDHGQAMGLDVYGGRDVIFDLWVKTDGTSLQHAMLALAAATVVRPNEELPLWFQLPNLPLLCVMCRPRKRPYKIDADYAAGNISQPELVLHATDPRIYTAATSTAFTPNFPATSHTLNNLGNTELRPIVIFTGPITGPRITNEGIAGNPFIELIEPTKLRREREEESAKKAAEEEEEQNLRKWAQEERNFEITKKQREEKEAKQKEERETREADEKEEKEAIEKGEALTVKAGDQILLDLGTPHRVLYYVGGVSTSTVPTNVASYVSIASSWWDLIPGNNKLKFSSADGKEKVGSSAAVQWASAYEL